jgi:hypothetical protein
MKLSLVEELQKMFMTMINWGHLMERAVTAQNMSELASQVEKDRNKCSEVGPSSTSL